MPQTYNTRIEMETGITGERRCDQISSVTASEVINHSVEIRRQMEALLSVLILYTKLLEEML